MSPVASDAAAGVSDRLAVSRGIAIASRKWAPIIAIALIATLVRLAVASFECRFLNLSRRFVRVFADR
jgi:hypothetical protein